VYDTSAGEGTCSYIIDTGIYVEHHEFEGRATNLADFTGEGAGDQSGHGTHVSGIVGSRAYGVAKKTSLYGVKVLGGTGSGTTAGVIQGMNFVATDSATRCPAHSVANMSLGGAFSAAINSAARALTSSGVFVAVAAGNEASNVANYSPASEPSVCTVAASTINDSPSSGSNYGAGIDVYAPGTNIVSTWIGSPDAVVSFFTTLLTCMRAEKLIPIQGYPEWIVNGSGIRHWPCRVPYCS
jgi:subtilisin family serine protease